MRKPPIKLFAILLFVVFISMTNIAYVSADTLVDTSIPSAAGNPNKIDFKPVTNIPLLDNWSPGQTINAEAGASNVFNQLFSLSIRIGAMLAVFMFIWGGLNMIMARDNASNITRGKEKMKNAILGLLMLLSTFVVLNTINPNLVNISLFGDSTVRLSDTADSTEYYNKLTELQQYEGRNDLTFCGVDTITKEYSCTNNVIECIDNYGVESCNLLDDKTRIPLYCFGTLYNTRNGRQISNVICKEALSDCDTILHSLKNSEVSYTFYRPISNEETGVVSLDIRRGRDKNLCKQVSGHPSNITN